MFVQEAVQHGAAAAEGQAEKFDAGETIIQHVANSSLDDPLIHLPTILGIDFSVTKHVMMLWVVAALLFVVVTWAVRRYLKQDRLIPSGFMNALEAVVEFVRDDDRPAQCRQQVGDDLGAAAAHLLLLHPLRQRHRPHSDLRRARAARSLRAAHRRALVRQAGAARRHDRDRATSTSPRRSPRSPSARSSSPARKAHGVREALDEPGAARAAPGRSTSC